MGFVPLILLAIFVVPSSISGTAIALPAIARDTNADLTLLHWVVNAFNLTFACLTLVWGALSDQLGRKRCFLAGVVIYGVGSFISGMSPNIIVLDIGRALAGAGAAAVFSCGIALLSSNFEGNKRVKVFALFGTVAGLGVSLGPTLSGLLLDTLGWRVIFYTHLTLLSVILIWSKSIPRDEISAEGRLKFDYLGALFFAGALFSLILAIVQSSQWGWQDPGTAALVLLSAGLFVVFWQQEKRHPAPMLDLSLLTSRAFIGYSLITVAGSFGFVTLLTYFPTYVTSVLQMSATAAGLTMLLLTAPLLVFPNVAGRLLAGGVPASIVVMSSLGCLLVGVLSLAWISEPNLQFVYLVVPLLLIGAGFGLTAGMVDALALQVVPERKSGMAAGLLNTFRLGSEAIAVSLYGSVLATLLHDQLNAELSVLTGDAATLRGWVNDIAAGKLNTTIPISDAMSVERILQVTIHGYDGAFHGVLWLLVSVLLILAVVIGLLIRDAQGRSAAG
ncbi:Multidrug resistance protein stp [Pseudovibrio axinellae]|uniref:Multidrug resistance protein stp n=2 Tax=Pseudovibrio axinellae TaxID=989403 RepID=A0A165XQD4_9HYPH|nr:Multidrug resistance protein stp [Pseudovibrio axinellae]SER15949.1 Major Facilitator Superfamily protein [Pseudovibrio axinellae]